MYEGIVLLLFGFVACRVPFSLARWANLGQCQKPINVAVRDMREAGAARQLCGLVASTERGTGCISSEGEMYMVLICSLLAVA
jgi:hypothetical protein